MKIYTKTGDKGETSLLSGGRVSKSNQRIEAYGSTDELNSFIGLLNASEINSSHKNILTSVQNKLYHIGSHLAAKDNMKLDIPKIEESDVELIENEIDILNNKLPPLKFFIIPGGDKSTSLCHVCRSICRRAEREVVKLSEIEKVEEIILNYLNRLSDYFFVLARKIAQENNTEEIACIY